MSAVLDHSRFGSGKTVRRIEDPVLVAGLGRFTDDVTLPGQAHLVFLRSPQAHARIVSVDTADALAVSGVIAVITGADLLRAGVKPMPAVVPFARPDGTPFATADRFVIAHDRVRHVGEAVAAVVAETREAAALGADAVLVEYDELPPVVDPLQAMAPGAPALCDQAPDNVACEARHGDAVATAEAFAKATHVVSVQVVNQRLAPTPLEPRVVLAEADAATGRLVVRLSSQMPTSVLGGICDAIPGLAKELVRIVVGEVGGGFGMKGGVYPEDIVVAWAAWTLKRPVKWCAQRLEEFTSAVHGRDVVSRSELALDSDGRVLALRVRAVANVGGYATPTGVMIPLLVGPWVATSIYDIRTIDFQLSAVMTNTAPVGAYRGAGRPEAVYIIERLMDAAARELDLDPAELRRRNLIRPEQMPYQNPMGQT